MSSSKSTRAPPIRVVPVTGASGFIGSHIVNELLHRGYHVRACVRNKEDAEKTAHLSALLERPGVPKSAALTFYNADLFKEGSYDEAFSGADAVIHSAAVVEIHRVRDPMAVIVNPSVQGTANVLASVDKAGTKVQRLVHTSSISAIINADRPSDTTFTEADWNQYSTIATGDPYGYAKTKAEELVWSHVKANPSLRYDVVVINPGVALGPCLTKAHTKASPAVLRQMLYGNEQPNYCAAYVDVRDVARAHVNALECKDAGGQRILCTNPDTTMWVIELGPKAQALFPEYVVRAVPIASWKLWLAWLASFVPYTNSLLTPYGAHMISKNFYYDSSKSKALLKLQYAPLEETLKETIASMVDNGWIKPKLSGGKKKA